MEHRKHCAPRRQKPPLPGKRPGVLTEPGAQVAAVTVGYVAAAVPLPTLGLPVLAGASGEGTDAPLLRCMGVMAQQCQDSEAGKAWFKDG